MLLSQIPWTQLNQIRRMTGPIFTQAAFSLSWFLISIERLACHGLVSLAAVFRRRGGALRDDTKNGCEGD